MSNPASKAPRGTEHGEARQRMAGPADSGRSKFLSAETERALLERWVESRDRDALERLVNAHKPLVLKYASRQRASGLPLSDLAQEGYVGLMEAAHRFDLSKEVRFATYAQWWIKAAIQEYILRNAGTVRTVTSTRQRTLLFALRRLVEERGSEAAISPDERQELAGQFGVSADTVDRVIQRMGVRDRSLDSVVGEDGTSTLGDMIADPSDSPEEIAAEESEAAYRRELLMAALAELPERERRIIEARHLQENRHLLLDLGSEFGVSKERVRQLEQRALDKLARSIRRQRQEAAAEQPAVN